MDGENPRSLACSIDALKTTLMHLPITPGQMPLDRFLEMQGSFGNLVSLCQRDDEGRYVRLLELTGASAPAGTPAVR